MSKSDRPGCCAKIFQNWQEWPCSRKASVEVDGRHYCGIHDPIKRAAKHAERMAVVGAQYAERKKQRALELAAPELLAALRDCSERLAVHMAHSDDLVAHMKAVAAIAKAEGRA